MDDIIKMQMTKKIVETQGENSFFAEIPINISTATPNTRYYLTSFASLLSGKAVVFIRYKLAGSGGGGMAKIIIIDGNGKEIISNSNSSTLNIISGMEYKVYSTFTATGTVHPEISAVSVSGSVIDVINPILFKSEVI